VIGLQEQKTSYVYNYNIDP